MITIHLSKEYSNAELFESILAAHRLHSVVIRVGKMLYHHAKDPLELYDASTDTIIKESLFATEHDWYAAILASWCVERSLTATYLASGKPVEVYSPLPRGTHDTRNKSLVRDNLGDTPTEPKCAR